jgi:hypothetical protein
MCWIRGSRAVSIGSSPSSTADPYVRANNRERFRLRERRDVFSLGRRAVDSEHEDTCRGKLVAGFSRQIRTSALRGLMSWLRA